MAACLTLPRLEVLMSMTGQDHCVKRCDAQSLRVQVTYISPDSPTVASVFSGFCVCMRAVRSILLPIQRPPTS